MGRIAGIDRVEIEFELLASLRGRKIQTVLRRLSARKHGETGRLFRIRPLPVGAFPGVADGRVGQRVGPKSAPLPEWARDLGEIFERRAGRWLISRRKPWLDGEFVPGAGWSGQHDEIAFARDPVSQLHRSSQPA